MPFLFVDYDAGAGGEFFCANLSKSPQCNMLESIRTYKNRTKVNDIFDQEFLKLKPHPKKVLSGSFYDIVPTHRNTPLANEFLGGVFSLRIANPTDSHLTQYLNFQRIQKLLRAPLPSPKHFFGELDNLMRVSKTKDWVRDARIGMDYIDLILLAHGIEINETNREQFIEQNFSSFEPEPEFDYSLSVPYEDLFFNTNKIKEDIKKIFSIDIVGNWLDTYKENYDVYCSQT